MTLKLTSQAQAAYRLQKYGDRERIDGVEIHSLSRFNDDGGSMTELMRVGADLVGQDGFRLAQVNYSCLQPGATKAFHLHRQQTDIWFVPPEDRVLAVLLDLREGSSTEGAKIRTMLGDGNSSLLRIPPGVAHGCRNLGTWPARIIYFTDRHFSAEPEQCDEGRLPWDFAGKQLWDVSIE